MPHGCEICLSECYYVALHFHTSIKCRANTTEVVLKKENRGIVVQGGEIKRQAHVGGEGL